MSGVLGHGLLKPFLALPTFCRANISPKLLMVTLEKTPAFRLPVATKPNKQRQRPNLYGHFIRVASDLRRWWVCTLTDHLVFSFQGKVFIAGNKQGAVRGLKFRED